MPRTLLKRYCIQNPDGSYQTGESWYDTSLRQQGLPQAPDILTNTISCSYYSIPEDVILDTYCVTVNGQGMMRTVTTIGGGLYLDSDAPSSACDGTCDLTIYWQGATNTTTTISNDGTIRIEAKSSFAPITCYIATLGFPTTTATAAGDPTYHIFTYENVPAGSYGAQLQDNGNCQRSTNPLTVVVGPAPGTGNNNGVGNGIDWLKYKYIHRGTSPGQIEGLAWNKTTKQEYTVAPITLNFPRFYQYTPRYRVGDIVQYGGSGANGSGSNFYYFQAQVDMQVSAGTGQKQPYPDQDGITRGQWKQLSYMPLSIVEFAGSSNSGAQAIIGVDFVKTPPPINGVYYIYEPDRIVRYDWTGFYRSKVRMETRNFGGSFPEPTIGGDNQYWEKVDGYDFFYYNIEEDEVIDQYPVGNLTRRVRFHTANPSISGDTDRIIFDDSNPSLETGLGDLKVVDIIKNDIDTAGAENGSVWVQAVSPSLPIRYHLRNGVRAGYQQDNTTGIYGDLHAGSYIVDIYDAQDRYVSASFEIEDRYAVRWQLEFDDLNSEPLQIQILERDWSGPVTNVTGTDEPVILSWDSGSDPAGYLPEAVGANLDFNLYTGVAQQFLDTIKKDDRNHRVDYYRGNQLQFRGYIDATSYTEKMLGAGQKVTITATDGLGQLRNTKFINHLRERQEGRTSMLSILLKCLSFCDVNLPIICGINLRDRLMSADGDPLMEAYVHRNAYQKRNDKVIADEDIIDCRTVVDAILRLFNAMLFQADGYWHIIALNEVQGEFVTRTWSPAGTMLSALDSNTNVGPAPLRVLQSKFATGERELFWINASQTHTVVAAAQIGKAIVDLQLEENLFRNGDFVQWDGASSRPLYWTKNGSLPVARTKGEKAKEYAVKFTALSTTISPSDYLLSPPAPHLPGQDEDGMLLKFKALVEPTTNNPAEIVVSMYFQILCDGNPFGQPIEVEISSKDKWKEYELPILTGLPGNSVRVRMLNPVKVSGGPATVSVNSVAISIRPGLVDWSEQKQDHFEVTNPATTGIRLEDIELVHADLPLLPNFAGQPLPPKKMDVYAWRHAVSLADFRATTGWKRPDYPAYTPLLDNAAQDRMALRAVPNSDVTGEVRGPGIKYLRQGMMLDMPEDLDGRFLIISCFKNERRGEARITVRKLATGNYGGVEPVAPDKARIATINAITGYRIAFKNGTQGYRIAEA